MLEGSPFAEASQLLKSVYCRAVKQNCADVDSDIRVIFSHVGTYLDSAAHWQSILRSRLVIAGGQVAAQATDLTAA